MGEPLLLSPILIFTYKRLDTLHTCIKSLQRCGLAQDSIVYIFSDAAKNSSDEDNVRQVRSYINNIAGFKNIIVKEASTNKGLANSIIEGVSEVLRSFDKVIVLEDDLEVSENFLYYMNAGLKFYQDNRNIFSISGYSFPFKVPKDYKFDIYFTKRASSWGWATWSDRWAVIDWTVKDFSHFDSDIRSKKAFNKIGSDLSDMLKRQMNGKMDSWAIRWVYHQFKNDLLTVYPVKSKIKNIGFGGNATHTFQRFNRYGTVLDDTGKTNFEFCPDARLDTYYNKKFTNKYSIQKRLIYKILNAVFH